MAKNGYVYIMSSANKAVLYTGVTSTLKERIWQHRNKFFPSSFTSRFNCVVLVYYLNCDTIEQAIVEEKRIKGGSRKAKEQMIERVNPLWKDLWDDIF